MSSSSSSYVCFPCRKHHSIDRFPSPPKLPRPSIRQLYWKEETEKSKPPAVLCPNCNLAMYHIGHKLEIPRHSDVEAWKLFYDQLTAPGYGSCAALDEDRDRENMHWVECRLRLGGKSCDRCNQVAKRLPNHGLGHRWNDVVR